mmetsp:Transcript_12477/g.20924  ORF Transcript_12477/g.20924 Transcript_12477/m.20924 type:complete len:332 (-) Transcript_12477:62-1057(-)|eukprot:CAMPEP_0119313292 /NCGR_PEP_ID=MMETSP1333-20130426/28615_1 /TAXON_ID=418940 /ORGANISM="Scyphosphaera apsteinii, Strain RCC1455" /LENGTH=331 /DNA_ID=CAMNT_0007318095 /DNA_START=51 /DNA_END=1049 /DNA_ORIENTATION=-
MRGAAQAILCLAQTLHAHGQAMYSKHDGACRDVKNTAGAFEVRKLQKQNWLNSLDECRKMCNAEGRCVGFEYGTAGGSHGGFEYARCELHWSTLGHTAPVPGYTCYIKDAHPVGGQGSRGAREALSASNVAARCRAAVVTIQQDFSGCYLAGLDLSYKNLAGAIFAKANLNSANFDNAILHYASLESASAKHTTLRQVDGMKLNLKLTNLEEADLSSAKLAGAELGGAILVRAVLTNADLHDATLTYAVASRAVLNGASFRTADLRFAELSHTTMNGTDFSHAQLQHVNFLGSDLNGAIFTDSNLDGAHFLDVVNMDKAIFTGAIGAPHQP